MTIQRAWLFATCFGLAAIQFIGCESESSTTTTTSSSSASSSSGDGGNVGAGGGGGAGGGSSSSSSGLPPECMVDTDCKDDGPFDFCGQPQCANGKCSRKGLQSPGTLLPSQMYGDCKERRCSIDFMIEELPVEDPYDDAQDCTKDVCTDGVSANMPDMQGTLCTTANGISGICDGNGACVQCIDGVQSCTGSFTCSMNKCVGALCSNGTKNPGEGDVDCGGACLPCADGKTCTNASQCASGVCMAGTCAAPTCSDAVVNGNETGFDCGGPDCGKCTTDEACKLPADCQSGVCIAGFCVAPTCTDAVQNGDETGNDCGGPCPTPCP